MAFNKLRYLVHYNLDESYVKSGQYKKAIEQLKKAIRIRGERLNGIYIHALFFCSPSFSLTIPR